MSSFYCAQCRRALEPSQVFGRGKPDQNGDPPPHYHRMVIYFALTHLMHETEFVPVHVAIHPVEILP